MTPTQADHQWTFEDELEFMGSHPKWDLARANAARERLGLTPLSSRRDMLAAYAAGLRLRRNWDGVKRFIPARAGRPEHFVPLGEFDIVRLIDAAEDIQEQLFQRG